jgi:uncharacterized membrane protein
MRDFLWGMLAALNVIAAMYFWHSWQVTRDRLFAYFAIAFIAFAANWIGLAMIDPDVEARHTTYLLRLLGFVLIIVGIVDKNRRSRSTGIGDRM